MALPKLNTPTYELVQPSTGNKIKYRPFLVKEQKVLMIAQDTGNQKDMIKAVSEMVKNCTFGAFDKPEELPIYDIEYMFLILRSKSAGETINLNILCEDDGKTRVPVTINIDDIKVDDSKKQDGTIQLTDDIGITMRYPSVKDVLKFKNYDDTIKVSFDIIKSCTVNIFDKDQVYDEYSEDEINGFLETMNSTQLEMVQQFLESVPKLSHTVKFMNPNTDVENTVVLEGLTNFLG